jgi:N-acetylmuramoyl-L-alanine amidase CwlA
MLLCPLKQLIPKNEQATKNVQKTEYITQNNTSNDIIGSPCAIAYMQDPNTLMQVAYYPPGYTLPSVNTVNTQEKRVGKYAERNRKKRERKALEKQVNAATQQRTDQTQQTMSSVPKTTVATAEKSNDIPKLKNL